MKQSFFHKGSGRRPCHTGILRRAAAVCLALLLLPCVGCAEKETSGSLFALDTYITMTIYSSRGEDTYQACADEIARLEKLLSTTLPESDIYRINHSEGAPVEVSEETAALLATAEAYSDATGSAFDATVRPLVELWGFEGTPQVPSADAIESALQKTGWSHFSISGTTVTADPGSGADLGGIAKGYVTDRLKAILLANDIPSALLVLGGNVYAHGSKPDGSPWRVAIQDPEDSSTYIGVARVQDCAVITSGGYQRYFEEDGVRYHHIIDPATGYPAESGVTSVTIFSPDGTLADALSTALFVMGAEKAEAFWRSRSDFDFVLVLSDGSILVTEGVDFTPETDATVTTLYRS